MLLEERRRGARLGFTLLELLVVVTILAIVGAGLLAAYDELDDKTSEGVSAHTMAGVDAAVRAYTMSERVIPNELDALIAAPPPANLLTDPVDISGSEKVALLPGKIGGSKTLGPIGLTQGQLDALNNAGLSHLRFLDPKGNDPASPAPGSGGSVTLDIPDADGGPAEVGPLLDIDIPHRAHEVPRPGSGRNRGRGYAGLLGVSSPVLQWNPDRSGGGGMYDNTKIGAGPDDVILVFGLGNDASVVGATRGRTQIASAPVFGKNLKGDYGRYLLLYNVGPLGAEFDKAKLQIVMNTHGDFIDEMITEFSGQKN